jgi:hypothetical protein
MTPEIQTILTAGIPTLAVVIGVLVDNARLNRLSERLGNIAGRSTGIDDLRSHLDRCFDDLEETLRSDLRRMAERLR